MKKLWLFFLSFYVGFSEGLFCFTCRKLICDEGREICNEIQHFPNANNRTRELSKNWRESPECPEEDSDLRWDRKFIQNCSESETSCGSYLLRVTLAVARNSINETEFPILVTPNYYHAYILALGCVAKVRRMSSEKGEDVPEYYMGSSNSSQTVSSTERTTAILMHNAPHVKRNNITKMIKETTELNRSYTTRNSSESSSTTASSTIISSNFSSTNLDKMRNISNGYVDTSTEESGNVTESDNKRADGNGRSTEFILPNNFAPTDPSVIDPDPFDTVIGLVLTLYHLFDEPLCSAPFSHVENRTDFGTLERINLTGDFPVCNTCDKDLCNYAIPRESDIPSGSSEEDNEVEAGSSGGVLLPLSAAFYLLSRGFIYAF